MKVQVIMPPAPGGDGFYTREDKHSGPLGPERLNPYLFFSLLGLLRDREPDWQIGFVEAQADDLEPAEVLHRIEVFDPDLLVVFVSAFKLRHDRIFAELDRPTITIPCPSSVDIAEAVELYDLKMSIFVRDEVEFTVLEAARELARSGAIVHTPGLVMNTRGRITDTGPSRPVKMTDLPMPAFDLMNLAGYDRRFLMYTSRGCHWKCTYCCVRDSAVDYKSVDQVLSELKTLVNDYGYRDFVFIDNEFSIKMSRAKAICREIIAESLGIRWACMTRVDLIDEELAELMVRAGCYEVRFGVESADERIQRDIMKGLTVERIKRAFAMTRAAGLATHAFVMVGLPGETEESIDKTVALLRDVQPDSVGCEPCYPTPGEKMYNDLKAAGRLLVTDWEEYKAQRRLLFRHEHYRDWNEVQMARQRVLNYRLPRPVAQHLPQIRGVASAVGIKRFGQQVRRAFPRLNDASRRVPALRSMRRVYDLLVH